MSTLALIEEKLRKKKLEKWIRVYLGDSSRSLLECKGKSISEDVHFDAVAANLPWVLNSIEYFDENIKIMKCLKDNLLEGIPCIFVSKNEISNELKELGFEVEGIAHV